MPSLNGDLMLEEMRRRGDETPVMMLTRNHHPGVGKLMLEKGFEAYVLKGSDLTLMRQSIEDCLRQTT